MEQPRAGPRLERPSGLRRYAMLLLIAALHLGFFYFLQDGLVRATMTQPVPEIITALIFPAPVKPQELPPQVVQTVPPPVARTVTTPRPALSKPVPRTAPPPLSAAIEVPTAAPALEPPAVAAPTQPAAAQSVPAAPAAPASSPPVAAPPKTLTSGVEYVQAPRPDYPTQSKRLGEEGKVVLRVLVNQQGRAERVELQTSSGHARLDDAALEAVRQARFKPHLEDGRPVTVFAIVPISFRLDQ